MYRGVQPVVGGQGRGHMEVGDENGNTVEMNTGNMTPTSVLTVISKDTGLKTVHRRMALCRLQLLQTLHSQVKSALPSAATAVLHNLQPGDWVLIKDHRRRHWKQRPFQGPFQVLLTTETAVKVVEKAAWVHASHCKRVPEPTADI
ncbi:uncharacterized protein LOC121193645 isoform X1 [Toxotes jaculatrix]|uniref:uncharacterized protein LOC121193645 isoform X1 n=1 Tax=Toxotes jaculatrix TaxID=941984 RepID=UPI001B3AEF5B|nr:uncharacterized protein LOC121193645 isoform X1 [Toxotes jaculatrix]